MITIENVYKRYKTDHGAGRWILNGLSLIIPPKVNVGLIGGNGAGKSTLLRLIGGVDHPTKGKIIKQTRVSWPMGLGTGLQPSLTGRQNAKFICRIYGHETELLNRIDYIQEFAEIGEAFDEPIRTYSTGMRSRLQFALSLAIDFDVYISDEVTSAGDEAFRKKAAKAFENLIGKSSLIMAGHGEHTLKQFCQSGIWLNNGKAIWFDDINEALREYKKSQLLNQVNRTSTIDTQIDNIFSMTKEKAELTRRALFIIQKGLDGDPLEIEDKEGGDVIKIAKEIGMNLLGPGMMNKFGYTFKKNHTMPIFLKHNPTVNRYVPLYDINTQCIKVYADESI